MPTVLATSAVEESTYVVTCAFTDAAGDAVAPSAITWTLTDLAGNVINARSGVIVTPAASIDIVLSGDDLAIGANGVVRELLISATYSSDEGSNLPLRQAFRFTIDDLTAVT